MYTEFYNLNSKPFQISSDPAFMWFGEKHSEALATLKYGILDNKGFLLLTGDVGTGKTSLINTLIKSLGQDIICAFVPDPSLEKLDFFNYIAAAFGIDKEFRTKGGFLAHFRNFLVKANNNNKKVLLIIDEAQLLTQELLEEIRLLSNIEKSDSKLINIFFIGQNEFNEILNHPQNRAVRQRMTLNYNLDPLTPDETDAYIRHRLKVAGTDHQLFDKNAVREIFLYSGGFPRRINVLCDHSLLSGFVSEVNTISAEIVKECAKELKIPAFVRNRDINGFKPQPSNITNKKPSRTSINNQEQTSTRPENQSIRQNNIYQRKNPWIKTIVFICFVIFITLYFLFPDDFVGSISSFKQESQQSLQFVKDELFGSPEIGVNKEGQKDKTDSGKVLHQEDSLVVQDNINEEPIEKKTSQIYAVPESKQVLPPPGIVIQRNIPESPDPPPDSLESQEVNIDDGPVPIIEVAREVESTQINQDNTLTETPPLPDEKVVIRFQYNTNDFTEKGFEELDTFSKVISMYPETRIRVTGHTDSQGYKKYNLKLSEFRANIVKSYLLGKGVNPDQIQVKGVGGKYPVENNDTSWGRKMNRRVEIEVIKN